MPTIPLYNAESAVATVVVHPVSCKFAVRVVKSLCTNGFNNMKFLIVILAIVLAVANAQFGHFGFQDNFALGGFGLNAAVRDPRANTGPVVFPPAPADSGMTSGVVVGASGYGFVPPNSPSGKSQSLQFF